MIGYCVMSILWLIVTIVAEVIALIAWLIWYIIRKVVEDNCYQVGDHCVCNAEKNVPFTGKEDNTLLPLSRSSIFQNTTSMAMGLRICLSCELFFYIR